MLARSWITS